MRAINKRIYINQEFNMSALPKSELLLLSQDCNFIDDDGRGDVFRNFIKEFDSYSEERVEFTLDPESSTLTIPSLNICYGLNVPKPIA